MRTSILRRLERLTLLIFLLALGGSALLTEELRSWGEQARQLVQFLPIPGLISPLEGRRVGLVAGHSGNDSGAVCPDGLREVDVNRAVVLRTAERLRRARAEVDVLDEFDERLVNYRADALVSIHSDSCIDATGFKVARAITSAIPEIEDRLVACLYQAYGQVTGLPRHDGSITVNMTRYHAFRVIAPETPAAIIELGFLGGDRDILTRDQDRLAKGVAQGIICFLTESQP
ncbi:MAG: N-acetylmuramoyl-L-alanine amidase [Anaerolineae bacterium]|nr:N-acetylmuramoyl-L-alanine amidase [Anaerolineae bacterium]MDW8100624.1 N-acetylmuramoyl-L-alanine amidase [Anaerolineae bacterium]